MTLNDLIPYLCEKYAPKAILLHGSRARGDAFEDSDYDLALIIGNPEQVRPEYYEGCALDIGGISPAETIVKSGQTPIWPVVALYDDEHGLGKLLAKRTEDEFLHRWWCSYWFGEIIRINSDKNGKATPLSRKLKKF